MFHASFLDPSKITGGAGKQLVRSVKANLKAEAKEVSESENQISKALAGREHHVFLEGGKPPNKKMARLFQKTGWFPKR